MSFKIGDLVVDPTYGAGQIVNIEKKQFSDTKRTPILQSRSPKAHDSMGAGQGWWAAVGNS